MALKKLKAKSRQAGARKKQKTQGNVQEGDNASQEVKANNLTEENKSMESELDKHKKELNDLRQKDPEFYEFLKANDQDLLEFDFSEDEGVEEKPLKGKKGKKGKEEEEEDENTRKHVILTSTIVESWCDSALTKKSQVAIRKLLKAYRSACHWGDEDAQTPGEGGTEEENGGTVLGVGRYRIAGSEVFNKILVFCLREMDGLLRGLLWGSSGGSGGGEESLEKSEKWSKIGPLIKSYLGNSLHILGQMTEENLLCFSLRRLTASVGLLRPFPPLARKFLKVALLHWGSGQGTLSVVALLFLRAMAQKLPEPWPEDCLRGLCREYILRAKQPPGPSTERHLAFLASSVAELLALNPSLAYPLSFSYLRQLALVLRQALAQRTQAAVRQVYCWSYLRSLGLWVQVVTAEPLKEILRPLAYPLGQLLLSTARLVPSARFFPLRAHTIRMACQLAEGTGLYFPLSGALLEMLDSRELKSGHRAGQGQGKPQDWGLIFKVSKMTTRTRAFQEETVSTAVELLSRHLAQWSLFISFPELSVVPTVHLRKFLKNCRVERFRIQVKQLIKQIEANESLVRRHRDKVDFSPKDSAKVASFMKDEVEAGKSPLIQFSAQIQEKARERRESLAISDVTVGGGVREEEDSEGSEGEEIGPEAEEATFASQWPPLLKKSENEKPEDEEDKVEDFVFSDDDEEEEAEGGEKGLENGDDEVKNNKENKKNNRKMFNSRTPGSGKPKSNKSKGGFRKPGIKKVNGFNGKNKK